MTPNVSCYIHKFISSSTILRKASCGSRWEYKDTNSESKQSMRYLGILHPKQYASIKSTSLTARKSYKRGVRNSLSQRRWKTSKKQNKTKQIKHVPLSQNEQSLYEITETGAAFTKPAQTHTMCRYYDFQFIVFIVFLSM